MADFPRHVVRRPLVAAVVLRDGAERVDARARHPHDGLGVVADVDSRSVLAGYPSTGFPPDLVFLDVVLFFEVKEKGGGVFHVAGGEDAAVEGFLLSVWNRGEKKRNG